MKHCMACKDNHDDNLFPSPWSNQCATSMIKPHGIPSTYDLTVQFVQAVGMVENVAQLPISEWRKNHQHWHLMLSRILYDFALTNPKNKSHCTRIKMWVKEEDERAS